MEATWAEQLAPVQAEIDALKASSQALSEQVAMDFVEGKIRVLISVLHSDAAIEEEENEDDECQCCGQPRH